MPRRRSGLNRGSARAAFVLGFIGSAALAVAGCQVAPTDNGCQITRQVVLPDTTPLALFPDVRLDPVGTTTFVFGSDGTTIYHAKGRDPTQGRWRTTDSQYCSTWRDVESCYDLYRNGDEIIWFVPETHHRYPSSLVKGRDTDF